MGMNIKDQQVHAMAREWPERRGTGVMAADTATVPLEIIRVHWALVGWRRFGKGQHPAALSFGDCFSHGLAIALGAPLLFKGDDFAATDAHRASLAIADGWPLVSFASGGFRLIQAPELLIREAHHGTRHLQGQRPIPRIEQIHRSLIAIRIAAGGGHPLQGLERQWAQRSGVDAKRLQGAEQPLDRVGALRLLTQGQQQGHECLLGCL
jgi:hypothetical protein